jgi:hypothetical protein
MANESLYTQGYTPSANEWTTIYAAPENVEYVEVLMVQCGNTGSVDRNVSVRWTAWSGKIAADPPATYYGDGVTVQDNLWDYSNGVSMVVNEALIPGKAALSVLDSSVFLGPKDFIDMKPGNSAQMAGTVTVKEYYAEGVSTKRYDASSVQDWTRGGIW